MAISDYASLLDAITRWSGGSSDDRFTDAMVDGVQLAETDLNDLLRVPEMVKRSLFTAKSEYEALPLDVAKLISIHRIVDSGRELPMRQIGEEEAAYYSRDYRQGSIVFALTGVQARFLPAPSPSSPMPSRILYYGMVPPISSAMPCTSILLRYPNVYLYGSLKHLAHYTEDDQKQQKWATLQIQEIQKANRAAMLRDATMAT